MVNISFFFLFSFEKSIFLSNFFLFLSSSVAVKQLILHLNKKTPFVIRDLDDTHIFIQSNYLEYINSQIEELLEKNVWDAAAAHSK